MKSTFQIAESEGILRPSTRRSNFHIFILSVFWTFSLSYNLSGQFKLLYTIFAILLLTRLSKERTSILALTTTLCIMTFFMLKITLTPIMIDEAAKSLPQYTPFGLSDTSFESISYLYALPFLLFLKKDIKFFLLNKDTIRHSWKIISALSGAIIILDFVLRFKHCSFQWETYSLCKLNGIYPTSNVTGLVSGFIALVNYIYFRNIKGFILFFMLTALTFSRSALIMLLLIFTLYFIVKRKYLWMPVATILIFISITDLPEIFLNKITNDGSFQSKIQLTLNTINSPLMAGSTFIFGGALSSTFGIDVVSLNNWSPHLSILKAYIYYGIIGLSIWIAIHLLILHFLTWKGKMIFIYLLAISFFGSPIFNPLYFFLILVDHIFKTRQLYNKK